jgi:hypothetical protein
MVYENPTSIQHQLNQTIIILILWWFLGATSFSLEKSNLNLYKVFNGKWPEFVRILNIYIYLKYFG